MSLCNNANPVLNCNGETATIKNPINNQKQFRMSSSAYLDNKKALTVIGPSGNMMLAQGQNNPVKKCVSNVGGPGDKTPALYKHGLLRAYRKNNKEGVDRKHGSYERYLARKRGWNIVKLECN
jgi:hypothetical protein